VRPFLGSIWCVDLKSSPIPIVVDSGARTSGACDVPGCALFC
jgi:hypothetical protein